MTLGIQEYDYKTKFDLEKARQLKPLLAHAGSPEALRRISHAGMVRTSRNLSTIRTRTQSQTRTLCCAAVRSCCCL